MSTDTTQELTQAPPTDNQVEPKPNSVAPIELQGLDLIDQAQATVREELAHDRAAADTGSAESGSAAVATPVPAIRKLSILVPFYNERWTLADCLRRVANVDFNLDYEIIAVDDGSTDGSAELVQQLTTEIPGLSLFRQPENRGKGAAIRRAIEEMTGDAVVIQDADLEYDPADLPALIAPIVDGRADAVFGSRFSGGAGRCLPYWHSQINSCLTFASNAITNLNLTDMETGYKVIRADILRELRLSRNSFTIEPELTCRLAQWGAKIFEVPISYQGRSFEEGKKIRAKDGIKALATLLYTRFVDSQHTRVPEDAMQRSLRRAPRYNRHLVELAKPFLGDRVLDAGAGVGNLSGMLVDRERLVLAEYDLHRADRLRDRFGARGHVRVCESDLVERDFADEMLAEKLDSILCVNTLQQIGPDFLVLRNFYSMLQSGGQCVLIVPQGAHRFGPIDVSLGHQRRYERAQLEQLVMRAGFEIVKTHSFNKLGGAGWTTLGRGFNRRRFGSLAAMAMNAVWPIAKYADPVLPMAPLSLMVVGRK